MTSKKKPRVLSGIQPSGNLTIGNYIGSISQWVKHQHEHENLFFLANLHTLTLPEDMTAVQRRQKTREVAGLYIACGLDPKQSTIFIQSHIAEHAELAWVLNCVTPLGWLERMTQFKAKAEGRASVGTGLLSYPVLMAADILIYRPDFVPVGDDQKQHVEIACDIAQRFNNLFGEVFLIPKPMIPKTGARIMGLDDPTAKMSKSTAQFKAGHAVGLLDDEKNIRKAVMSSVTDSGRDCRFEHCSPGVHNLLTIFEALTHESREQIESRFHGQGYGVLKQHVFDVVIETIRPIQKRYHEIADESHLLDQIIAEGARRARPMAQQMMQKVRDAVGI